MKHLIFLLVTASFLFISCKKEVDAINATPINKQVSMGESIFRNEGNCQSCHRPDQKIVGPSLQEIAQIYTQNKASLVPFLQGNQDPIVDPSEYESMKVNLELTKSMSEEQLKALEAYMLSFLPKPNKNLD